MELRGDQCCGMTDVGRVRDLNEDRFHVSSDGRLLIVADGMGGHAGGEVASALAVETIVASLSPERRHEIDMGARDVGDTLREAFIAAHRRVREEGRGGHEGMGATLVTALVVGDELWTCHVGDVRCYVRTPSGFQQITRDHSVVGDLVRQGHLTTEQARVHPSKNEVLQAIGMSQELSPDINRQPLVDGDHVLVCSDGLWESLSDEEIRTILEWEGSVRQRVTQLVDRANNEGGADNVTAVLYEHRYGDSLNELA
jgi:protein phosphatase